MKTVFSSNAEVSHIWASQTQYEGRAGNVFFEDGVIYSYGRHFPVAKFCPEYGNVVLFTDRGYSNSTAKHKSLIRSAIPRSYNVVYCDDPTRNAEHNLGKWQKKVDYLRIEFASKTHKISRGNIAVEIFKTCESAIVFCMALKIQAPDWTNESNDEMTARDHVYELAKTREAKREAKREEKARISKLEATERLVLWLRGESVYMDGFQHHETMLRIKGETIETSRGAKIPVSDAIAFWPMLQRTKRSGKTLEAGLHNINLGAYRFNSFDGNTLIVGCHSIGWNELEKMAIQLNLMEVTA